jgi:hypothetical protein
MVSRRFGVVLGLSLSDCEVVGSLLVGLHRSLKALFSLFCGIVWDGYSFGDNVSGALGEILLRGCRVRGRGCCVRGLWSGGSLWRQSPLFSR